MIYDLGYDPLYEQETIDNPQLTKVLGTFTVLDIYEFRDYILSHHTRILNVYGRTHEIKIQ